MPKAVSINSLKNQVIELTVRLQDAQGDTVGHFQVSGRVRLVAESPAVWVGHCCLPWSQEVTPDSLDGPDAYVCYPGEINQPPSLD